MVKRVFVFSDMEFDKASLRPCETDYEAIQRKFNSSGGFSKNLLTLFLKGGRVINPKDVPQRSGSNPKEIMAAAISEELYQKLLVCDRCGILSLCTINGSIWMHLSVVVKDS
ncbi:hypothetical protein Tco_1124011 [Tanacetum coccineum]|uniref:DUF7788 domain-containing protein n=1 Tax=Tanacetum coccineum TaxID=301880 RepID=A0ABQ5J623_9ASTR